MIVNVPSLFKNSTSIEESVFGVCATRPGASTTTLALPPPHQSTRHTPTHHQSWEKGFDTTKQLIAMIASTQAHTLKSLPHTIHTTTQSHCHKHHKHTNTILFFKMTFHVCFNVLFQQKFVFTI
eukprot:c13122_g2_i1.p1 GENE.c13122_g2_i1~~c13122_g2_i1.p1  ORF type:complete len:124 (-),score=26.76 c13122_g2_i1:39-410(-)